jgi:hypothetical protein
MFIFFYFKDSNFFGLLSNLQVERLYYMEQKNPHITMRVLIHHLN